MHSFNTAFARMKLQQSDNSASGLDTVPANVLRWQRNHYTHDMLRRMKAAIALVDKR